MIQRGNAQDIRVLISVILIVMITGVIHTGLINSIGKQKLTLLLELVERFDKYIRLKVSNLALKC